MNWFGKLAFYNGVTQARFLGVKDSSRRLPLCSTTPRCSDLIQMSEEKWHNGRNQTLPLRLVMVELFVTPKCRSCLRRNHRPEIFRSPRSSSSLLS